VLSEEFVRKWREREPETPFYTKIKEAVRPPGPLKSRLNLAIKRIELQIRRLEKATNRFSKRDKSLFARTVKAYSKRDMVRANVFANELAEIRKVERMIIHARLAMEQIVLRLGTVSQLGDVVSALAPTVGVLRSVRTGMTGVLPEAERELGQIGNLLNEIIIDAGGSTELGVNFKAANEDAQKILEEAATVAEQKIKEELPEIPSEFPVVREKVPTQT
jgi:division protein CdvB (Snf7/Vps24/ESCRT-III family)